MPDTPEPAPPARVGEQRPGGRAERVRAAVLTATSEVLGEKGYDGLTIDEVATRAGVHKTTVYRRWPTKPDLVAAAARLRSEENIPVPDTGSLAEDLRSFVGGVVKNLGTERARSGTRSLVAAAAGSSDLMVPMHDFWSERFRNALPIVERAVERGELPPETDAKLVVEAVIGPIWVRVLLTGDPIGPDLADRTAALVTAGARAMAWSVHR